MQAEEDQEQGVLVHASYLLHQLQFQDRRPFSPLYAELIQDVMKVDICPQVVVDDQLHNIP